jgi:FAD-linked sulfhydryl oxidase
MNWAGETPQDDCDGCNMMKVLTHMNEKLKKAPLPEKAHTKEEDGGTKPAGGEDGPHAAATQTHESPLDLNQLGSATWGLLHTMAAYYPTRPSPERQRITRTFLEALGDVFPCHLCGDDWKRVLQQSPPNVSSQHDFSQWLCRAHNDINERLGKELFPCEEVNQRWRANIFEVRDSEEEKSFPQ